MTLIFNLQLLNGCADYKTLRDEKIKRIEIGDSVDKLIEVFGEYDMVEANHRSYFPEMETSEDSIFMRYYWDQVNAKNYGLIFYTDSKKVLSYSKHDW